MHLDALFMAYLQGFQARYTAMAATTLADVAQGFWAITLGDIFRLLALLAVMRIAVWALVAWGNRSRPAPYPPELRYAPTNTNLFAPTALADVPPTCPAPPPAAPRR